MKKLLQLPAVLAFAATTIFGGLPALAQDKPSITLNWSYYAYWYQWEYAERAGIVDKWEALMGVEINVVEANSYVASMDQFRAGDIDAVTVTNGDAWAIALNRPSVYLIAGDYSNGNDLVQSNQFASLQEAIHAKAKFRYEDNSVSDTLLWACAQDLGVDIRRLRSISQAESDLVIPFTNGSDATVVAWKPFADQITETGANTLCDSSQYPGLIVDGLLIGADVPQVARDALAGIWYEVVQSMGTAQDYNDDVLAQIAAIPGDSLESYKSQLATTARLDNPEQAINFLESDLFVDGMRANREWLLTTGLSADDLDSIGVALPNGTVLGDASNVQLVFDTETMQKAADGQLQ